MPALNKETFLKKVIKRKRTSYGFQPFSLLARVRCYKRWDRKVFPEGQQEEKEEEMEGMKAGRSAGQLLGILLPQLSNNDVHNVFEHNAEVQSRSAPTTTPATTQCRVYSGSATTTPATTHGQA